MTIQEEISKRLSNILRPELANRSKADYIVALVIGELHSQGVVIQVEGELPEPDITTDSFPQSCNEVCHKAEQQNMLNKGYRLVKPLIEEE